MSATTFIRELPQRARRVVSEVAVVIPVGLLAGSASAFFLWSLDAVTRLRWQWTWIVWGLPLAGVVMAWVYRKYGDRTTAGNNLILDEIHAPGAGVPRRMAPLILGATLVTHLFGGSAGREGTAVQMGGSLAEAYARLFAFGKQHRRLILMAGVAAGFGSVFGTPLTGAIFAVEVLVAGELRHTAVIPLFVASLTGDLVCRAWGIHHEHLILMSNVETPWILAKAAGAGILFGLTGLLFITVERSLKKASERWIAAWWLRPVFGALLVLGISYALGTRDYLGLSVATEPGGTISLKTCFSPGGVTAWSWWWKLLLTAITLGFGFKGGEVTPLFFVGAALGNVLGPLLGLPVDLCAALGFVAVFAGASNTPFACTVMAVELFGGQHTGAFAAACFMAYLFSGYDSLYRAQRGLEAKRSLQPVKEQPVS